MSLYDLSSASLERLLKLVAEKEAAQAKLERIRSSIEDLMAGRQNRIHKTIPQKSGRNGAAGN